MNALDAVTKLYIRPYKNDEHIIGALCPSSFGFLDEGTDCPFGNGYEKFGGMTVAERQNLCEMCWKREIHLSDIKDEGLSANFYQIMAMQTMKPEMKAMDQLTEGLMGLAGESGEALDILKKHKFQGHELERRDIALELGDVAWYLAEAANAIGYSLSDIFRMNLVKLNKRFPNGFNTEDSVKRVDEGGNDNG